MNQQLPKVRLQFSFLAYAVAVKTGERATKAIPAVPDDDNLFAIKTSNCRFPPTTGQHGNSKATNEDGHPAHIVRKIPRSVTA
jgi:hypothetical protein